jgi:putative endonuclease
MSYYVYILYSRKLNRFYTGFTRLHPIIRLDKHLNNAYGQSKFSSKANDWKLFLSVTCRSHKQALNIENHIKRMKSRKYIEGLKKYPEIIEKLVMKYAD